MEVELVRFLVMIIAGKMLCIVHNQSNPFIWFIFTWILLAISYCVVPSI